MINLAILRRIELGTLCLFMLFLPLFEAPKNIFWVLYVGLWLTNRFIGRDFGGAWNRWDTLFSLWLLSGVLTALFGGIGEGGGKSPVDILRYVGLAWLISRAGYDKKTLYQVFIAIACATLIALGEAYWALLVTGKKKYLELHSVGFVNHTGIYLAIALGALLARIVASRTAPKRANSYAWALLTILVGASLMVTASRAAIGAAAATITLYLLIMAYRKKLSITLLFALIATAGAALGGYYVVLKSRPEVVVSGGIGAKNTGNLQAKDYLSHRDRLWELAVVAGMEHPWFGVGFDQFGKITASDYCAWRTKIQPDYVCVPGEYFNAGHAHNLYFNTLAERGFVGLSVLLLVLGCWLIMLFKTRQFITDDFRSITLWGGAFSAWGVTVFSGLLNTSLHHEHALLAVSLLALWLGWVNTQSNEKLT